MSLRSGFTGSEWCGTGANSLGLPIVLSGMSSISIHGIALPIAKDNLLDCVLDDLFTDRANDCRANSIEHLEPIRIITSIEIPCTNEFQVSDGITSDSKRVNSKLLPKQ
uniref:Uncharacterized protein n=1 Tax=Vespula pensylvanica TaxID=30213 RepID=A0A834P0J2_VESPE|nr:hypothetical protein H0235_008660 [Vespula pensylvanica]